MSFSREVRNQLAQLPVEKTCCRQTQLLALTIVSGFEAHGPDGSPQLAFSVDNAAVARHLFKLGKAIFGAAPLVLTRLDMAHRHHHFRVQIPVTPSGMMPALLTFSQLQETLAKKSCCRRSFLRGAFLGCGSLVTPTKAYHLEFNASEVATSWLLELLGKEHIQARCYQRASHSEQWTVYIKDAAEIASFLTLIGATQALFELEEVRIGKDLVNNVQRVVNCETANLSRTLKSAERQLKELQWLEANGQLSGIPDDWRSVAVARLESPYASLQELGDSVDPPMSKSAINHRLRLLHQAYEQAGGPPI